MVDPFWGINLRWDKETVLNMLYESSINGNIENCVFSFYKVYFITDTKMNARIKATLNNPAFEKNEIKSLDYSLVAQFKNETTAKFNTFFFDYFMTQMSSAYGKKYLENIEGDTIFLTWNNEKGIVIKATIFRDINSYNVSVKLKN